MKKEYLFIAMSLVGLVVFYLLLRKVGLIKSPEQQALRAEKKATKEEKKNIKSSLTKLSAFDPKYYKEANNPRLLTVDSAIKVSENLRKYIGQLNLIKSTVIGNILNAGKNEKSKIFGLFKAIPAKTEVSQVSDAYFKAYKADLLTDLSNVLTNAELVELKNVVANMV